MMRKALVILMTLALSLVLTGCTEGDAEGGDAPKGGARREQPAEKRTPPGQQPGGSGAQAITEGDTPE